MCFGINDDRVQGEELIRGEEEIEVFERLGLIDMAYQLEKSKLRTEGG